jgi:hypothetical protein
MERVHAEFVTLAKQIGYWWKTADPRQSEPTTVDVIQPKLSYKAETAYDIIYTSVIELEHWPPACELCVCVVRRIVNLRLTETA